MSHFEPYTQPQRQSTQMGRDCKIVCGYGGEGGVDLDLFPPWTKGIPHPHPVGRLYRALIATRRQRLIAYIGALFSLAMLMVVYGLALAMYGMIDIAVRVFSP